ncbi:PLL family lectin [Streptomyces sp. YKOK-I1]
MNGDWLMRGRDGRLSVYLTSDDAVLCRAERAPGGPWDGPRRVGGDQRLHPVLAVGQGADGYAHLVSWRPTVKTEASLVHSVHYRPLLAPLDWAPVGHPDRRGVRTGPPAVAVDAEGRAHVFVRGGAAGLGMLAQKEKGGWEPWRDLGGKGVEGPPVAVTGESGRIEVYAAVPGGILHWRQEEAGGPPVLEEALEAPVRPGTLRALATSAEHTTLYYTDDSGEVWAWRPGGKPAPLLAAAGSGPVAAIRCALDGHDCTLLAQRSASGRVAFAAYPTEQESAGAWWAESGPRLDPDAEVALAVDHEDRVVAATLSPSTGRLLLSRRKDEPVLALTAWQEV